MPIKFKDCPGINAKLKVDLDAFRAKAEEFTASHIGSRSLGTKKEAVKVHEQLFDEIVNFLMKDGLPAAFLSPSNMMDYKLQDIKMHTNQLFGRDVFNAPALEDNVSTARGVLNYLKKMFALHDKMKNKLDIDRKILSKHFPLTVSRKYDRFGVVGHAARKMMDFADWKVQMFLGEQKNIHNAFQSLSKHIEHWMTKGPDAPVNLNNSVMDGLDRVDEWEEHGIPIETKDGRRVKITGATYSETGRVVNLKLDDGSLVALEDLRKRRYIGDHGTEIMTEEDLDRALDIKYKHLLNEILDGQTRYVEFVDTISPEDQANIKQQILENKVRKQRAVEKGIIASEEEALSSPYIHKVRSKGITYEYMMVRQKPDETGREFYHGILLRAVYDDGRTVKRPPLTGTGIKNGFFKAEQEKFYGEVVNNNGLPIENSIFKAYTGFRYIRNQPNEYIMSRKTAAGTSNIWQTVDEMRHILEGLGKNIQAQLKEQTVKNDKLFKQVSALIGEDALQDLLDTINIHSNAWEDREGNLHTVNSEMRLKKDTYSPHLYSRKTVNGFIDNALNEIRAKKEETTDEETLKRLAASEYYLTNMGTINRGERKLNVEQIDIFAKYRKPWTDAIQRRKDEDIYDEYIASNAAVLARNERLGILLDSILKIRSAHKPGVSEVLSSYILNRFKIMDSNPQGNSYLFGMDIGAGAVSNMVKKVGVNAEPEDVELWFRAINAVVSSYSLDWMVALANRTQVANAVIHYGFKKWRDGRKILNPKHRHYNEFDAILDQIGHRDVAIMFSDMSFYGKDDIIKDQGLESWGIGLVTGSTFPLRSSRDLIRLFRMGKKGFVKAVRNKENKDAGALGEFLKTWEDRRVKYAMETAGRMQRRGGTVTQNRDVGYLAELYYELMTLDPKSNRADIIEQRIKALMPNIKRDALRTMVTWKLGFAIPGMPKDYTTFTSSEIAVRDEIAISALLAAKEIGRLAMGFDPENMITTLKRSDGSSQEISTENSIFATDLAIEIARHAVLFHAFGMSPVYLPEIFYGAGRPTFQFKGYPVQETLREARDLNAFIKSRKNNTPWAMGADLTKAVYDLMTGKARDLKRKDVDWEAVQAARMFLIRGGASIFSAALLNNRLIRWITGTAFTKFGAPRIGTGLSSVIRGAESPPATALIRLASRILLFAFYPLDDETDETLGFFDDLAFLLFPPLISIFLFAPLSKGLKWAFD